MLRHESEEHDDAQEILKRAAAIEAAGKMDQDLIRRTAAELGISEEAVAQAEKQWELEKTERADLRDFVRHQRRGFFSHLTSYLIINTFLLFINLFDWHGELWVMFPLLGWGIAIAFHAVGTFNKNSEDFQKEFEKWKAQGRAKRQS